MAKNEREVAAQKFLSQVEGLSAKPEVHVTGLNLKYRGDLRLALTAALRGKTRKEYFDSLGGLSKEGVQLSVGKQRIARRARRITTHP